MGIEPTSSAWKAEVLPLNYTRKHPELIEFLTDFSLVNFLLPSLESLIDPCISPAAQHRWKPPPALATTTRGGGGGRIRTYEGIASRFTVCPR